MSTALTGYVVAKITRTAPAANATLFIPDQTVDGVAAIDARAFEKLAIFIDADQPIDVFVQNAPGLDVTEMKDLAGYNIPAASFSTAQRNVIAINGAHALLGLVRLRIVTGATAPSGITVWFVGR